MARNPAPPYLEPAELSPRLLPYTGAEDDPTPHPDGFLASVALILRPAPLSPELLFIRRAVFEGDPWSGHMAFPGGRKDPADPSLLHTALRETREETALPLDDVGSPLGRLSLVAPRTPHLPPLSVVPFVFTVPESTPARVASPELAETLWVPVSHFYDPKTRTTYRRRLGGVDLTFPAFDLGERIVWGLTHRIVEDFLARLR